MATLTSQQSEIRSQISIRSICLLVISSAFTVETTGSFLLLYRSPIDHLLIVYRCYCTYQRSKMSSANSSEAAQSIPFKFGEYIVMNVLGEGAYATVARCFHPQTLEIVAVKALKQPLIYDPEKEALMLMQLSLLQPVEYNIIRFIKYFSDEDSECFVFETLDQSLDYFIAQRSPLNLKEIRPIAQQLLVAFHFLKTFGIIHGDLKLDNVMLVNNNLQPYKVKLIDFGLAGYSNVMDFDDVCQPYACQAPEATLGYKVTEAVDMWSLGCMLGECFTGFSLFSNDAQYCSLSSIIKLLGLPSRKMMQECEMSQEFFIPSDNFNHWRFKSPEEYDGTEGCTDTSAHSLLEDGNTLESVFKGSSTDESDPEHRDRMAFVDLIKRLLDMDPETRITPREALQHPFLMMEHLVGDHSEYSEGALGLMAVVLKDSIKVSDLTLPTSPNLQEVPQVVPELENPASEDPLTSNIEPENLDEPFHGEETSGTQTLDCIDKGILDRQMNIQPEQTDREFLYTDETKDTQTPELWDRPQHIDIEIPDVASLEDSDSDSTTSSNSSVWGRCKTAAFRSLQAGHRILAHVFSCTFGGCR